MSLVRNGFGSMRPPMLIRRPRQQVPERSSLCDQQLPDTNYGQHPLCEKQSSPVRHRLQNPEYRQSLCSVEQSVCDRRSWPLVQ